jgi:uncharacterized protein (TIGR03435 family)
MLRLAFPPWRATPEWSPVDARAGCQGTRAACPQPLAAARLSWHPTQARISRQTSLLWRRDCEVRARQRDFGSDADLQRLIACRDTLREFQDAVESAQCEPTQVSPPENLAFVSSSFEEDMNRQYAAPVPPVSIWFALAALALSPASGSAQSRTEQPQFDAASVKVNESADRPSTRYDPIRIDLRKASIKHLIRRAWPLPDYQIVWPAWVDAQRGVRGYDVSVTFPRDSSPQRLNLMFQDLLATRFGLVTHWESRELKAFEVRVSGQGSKLQEAKNPAPPTDFPKYTTRTESDLWHFSSQLGGAPSGLTVAGVLEAIDATHILDRPLVDATGIQGNYDIELTAPAEIPENRPAASELLKALEKQLGLKVTPKTLSLRMLVIDHLERIPTEN